MLQNRHSLLKQTGADHEHYGSTVKLYASVSVCFVIPEGGRLKMGIHLIIKATFECVFSLVTFAFVIWFGELVVSIVY